jgi:hypothetical protein
MNTKTAGRWNEAPAENGTGLSKTYASFTPTHHLNSRPIVPRFFALYRETEIFYKSKITTSIRRLKNSKALGSRFPSQNVDFSLASTCNNPFEPFLSPRPISRVQSTFHLIPSKKPRNSTNST